MLNDPLGDALAQIKNGYMARKKSISIPYSRTKEELIRLLVKIGFIEVVEVSNKNKKLINITLKYKGKEPVITNVVRVSKPGLRVYVNKDSIPSVLGGLGITIISTPEGLMVGNQAKKRKIGGELICKIW